jgi:hypothetical protein
MSFEIFRRIEPLKTPLLISNNVTKQSIALDHLILYVSSQSKTSSSVNGHQVYRTRKHGRTSHLVVILHYFALARDCRDHGRFTILYRGGGTIVGDVVT